MADKVGAYVLWTWEGGGQPNALTFDVVLSEQHELSATITEHPVEKGANITDHVRKNLDAITLSVFVSNTPLYAADERIKMLGLTDSADKVIPVITSLATIALDAPVYEAPLAPTPGSLFGAIGGGIRAAFRGNRPDPAATVQTYNTFDAVRTTRNTLNTLQERAQLVSVVTSSALYDNMAVVSVSEVKSADTGSGAEFSIQFKQIRLVNSKTVTAPKTTLASAVVKKGAQGTKSKPPEVGASLAVKAADAAGDTIGSLGSALFP